MIHNVAVIFISRSVICVLPSSRTHKIVSCIRSFDGRFICASASTTSALKLCEKETNNVHFDASLDWCPSAKCVLAWCINKYLWVSIFSIRSMISKCTCVLARSLQLVCVCVCVCERSEIYRSSEQAYSQRFNPFRFDVIAFRILSLVRACKRLRPKEWKRRLSLSWLLHSVWNSFM